MHACITAYINYFTGQKKQHVVAGMTVYRPSKNDDIQQTIKNASAHFQNGFHTPMTLSEMNMASLCYIKERWYDFLSVSSAL